MRGKGAKLGEGDPNRKNPETNSGFLCSGLLRVKGARIGIFTFGIFTFRIVSFGIFT